MLHPSYSELMEAVNSRAEEGEQAVVQSRYSIVKATAERAKQIIDARYLEEKYDKITIPDKDGKDRAPKKTPEDRRKIFMGKELIDNAEDMKPLSVAVKELYEGKIKIVDNTSADEDYLIKAQPCNRFCMAVFF